MYAVGGNPEAARRAGINVDRVRIAVFMIGGFMAGVGGIVIASRLQSVATNSGGGSLLLTDSPRTPRSVGDALAKQLSVPHRYHRWGDNADNPYLGFLGLADAFVVTGESMSMLAEAAAMGKPLYIFDVGDGDTPWWSLPHSYRYKPLSHRLAMRCGPERMRRDVGRIQGALVGAGRAAWLEEETVGTAAASLVQASGERMPPMDQAELTSAALAVRQLLKPR